MTRSALRIALVLAVGCSPAAPARDAAAVAELPATLHETGLYDAGVLPFTPQYPLWTDGARKQRWIYLPPGTAIDATDPDAWQFPVGTKLWKEFAFARRAETRFMERTAEGWRYATYVWSADERTAVRAPVRGVVGDQAIAPGVRHALPGEADCRACHAGPTPVLGFGALQLSADRDPLAVHAEATGRDALDLDALVARGLVRGMAARPAPRIAARTPVERAALGYLHGNCGSCHRPGGAAETIGMQLAYPLDADVAPALVTTVGVASLLAPDQARIAAGDPAASLVLARMRSRAPHLQMPPFGTQLVDDAAVQLLATWIAELPVRN